MKSEEWSFEATGRGTDQIRLPSPHRGYLWDASVYFTWAALTSMSVSPVAITLVAKRRGSNVSGDV